MRIAYWVGLFLGGGGRERGPDMIEDKYIGLGLAVSSSLAIGEGS